MASEIQQTRLKPVRALLQNGEEASGVVCTVKGMFPSWLNGHVLRNGPGEFDVGPDTFEHWFDGHALMHRFDIADGHVTYSSKFLRSEIYKTNHKHNRIVIGGFGTASIPDPCKNVFSRFFAKFISKCPTYDDCNVNIGRLGNVFYAITDAGKAYRIDENNLDTKNLIAYEELFGLSTTTAHPHYDTNGDYYNLGSSYGKTGYYCVIKVPSSSMHKEDPLQDLQIHSRIEIDDTWNPSYYHSFAMSENFIAFHDQCCRMNIFKVLKSQLTWQGVLSAYEHDRNRESVFHVINKKSGEKLATKFASKGRFCFHHINSYEEKVGNTDFLVIDMMCSDEVTFFWFYLDMFRGDEAMMKKLHDKPSMLPYRFVLPLDVAKDGPKGENLITLPGSDATAVLRDDGSVFLIPELLVPDDLKEKFNIRELELPQINYELHNGKKYKFMYCVGEEAGLPNQLHKVNIETKETIRWIEEDHYPSEPVFVRKPGSSEEDDGVILSTVISLHPQDPVFLLVVDAKTFKELGRAEVNVRLPYPLHACFTVTGT